MTELYINNRLVELPNNTSIKLLDENPYFTKSSKYTYDVEVPLKGSTNNIRIFGCLHRQDVEKLIVTYKARIISDNHTVIDGTATLTSVTENGIKLQILAGNAEMNFLSKYEKVYIDELTLGYITKPDGTAFKSSKEIIEYECSLNDENNRKFLIGTYAETNYIFMPVKRSDEDYPYNNIGIEYNLVGGGHYRAEFMTQIFIHVGNQWPVFPGYNIAPQPYMCYILRKILEVLGYSVVRNDIESTVMANEFIANDKIITDFSQVLPHWTISEYMTQIERHFGVVFRLNDITRNAEIINRDSYYKEDNDEYINSVEDEYTVTSDADETKDITDSNIKYSFNSVDKYMQIDEDVLKKFDKVVKPTLDELSMYYKSLSDDDKGKHVYEADGIQYYDKVESNTHSLVECNQYRRLIRDSENDSSDIELKIVPCEMATGTAYFSYASMSESVSFDVPYLSPASSTTVSSTGTLQEEIENTTSTDTKDVLEVAMNDGVWQPIKSGNQVVVGKSFPWPFILVNDLVNGEVHRGFSYELNKISSRPNMYSFVYGKLNTINTKSEIVYKIVTGKMLDPMKRYIINNKPYICEKIEYKITDKGIDKEKTGYFYEAGS